MKGKLPQRKIVTTAAARLQLLRQPDRSCYRACHRDLPSGLCGKAHGDRRGQSARLLQENVIRERPAPGDVVILLGGRTGRDGCGGATGSSKSHTLESLESCGAEVQKGNAPEERKLQRLFRNPEVTRMIKRCNDFGAGGVSRCHRRAGRRPCISI